MREEGEGDVLPAPRDRRVLTEAEVVAARAPAAGARGAPEAIERLYEYARPLAAAMDRFIADDERYLGEEDVSDEQLDETRAVVRRAGRRAVAGAATARPASAGTGADRGPLRRARALRARQHPVQLHHRERVRRAVRAQVGEERSALARRRVSPCAHRW